MMRVCLQPSTTSAAALQVTSTLPHSLCAVTTGVVEQSGTLAGLHCRSIVSSAQLSNTGAVTTVHVNVTLHGSDVAPHLSVAQTLNVWDLWQPLTTTSPGVQWISGFESHTTPVEVTSVTVTYLD